MSANEIEEFARENGMNTTLKCSTNVGENIAKLI